MNLIYRCHFPIILKKDTEVKLKLFRHPIPPFPIQFHIFLMFLYRESDWFLNFVLIGPILSLVGPILSWIGPIFPLPSQGNQLAPGSGTFYEKKVCSRYKCSKMSFCMKRARLWRTKRGPRQEHSREELRIRVNKKFIKKVSDPVFD